METIKGNVSTRKIGIMDNFEFKFSKSTLGGKIKDEASEKLSNETNISAARILFPILSFPENIN